MENHDDDSHIEPRREPTAREWWQSRRVWYNVALMMLWPPAYIVCVEAIMRHSPDLDIDAFSMIPLFFNLVLAPFVLGAANVCYLLGAWAERRIAPANVKRFRWIAFTSGLLFSVAAPFILPLYAAFVMPR